MRDHGCTHLYACDASGAGRSRELVSGPNQVVTGFSVGPGRVAVIVADTSSLGELAVLALADLRPLRTPTAYTRRALDERGCERPLAAQPRDFIAPDGTAVSGWVLRDPDAARPGPLLLDIHGGPHNAWYAALDASHLYQHELAARGWTVLTLNVRGSDGYGEEFYRASVGAWGHADEADFLAPVDELVQEGLVDPNRLAVAGYSYGGFMTCYLTSRTTRFAAAVAGGLVCDLVSLSGTSDEGPYIARHENLGEVHRDIARLRSQSPIERVGAVTTATLVLHGAEDVRCPTSQAEQWFTALRVMNVATELVLYPNESHTFPVSGAPSHRADYGERVTAWLDRHVTRDRPDAD